MNYKFAYMNPPCLNIKIQINIVTTDNIEPSTTKCPAKSASPSICFAILNEDTAVGEAKIDIKIANPTPRIPINRANDKQITGTITNLPNTPIAICFTLPFILENVKEPPKLTKASGVVTFDKSLIVFSNTSGILM